MIKDSLSYHPLPAETLSLFKSFITKQDEIPENFINSSLTLVNTNKNDSILKNKIIQIKADEKKLCTTSVFKDNLLKKHDINPILNKNTYDNWGLFLFIFCLFMLVIIKTTYSKRFNQIIKSFFNLRLMLQLNRDGNIFNERITALIYPVYFISFSFIFYEIIIYQFSNKISQSPYLIYLFCLGGFIIFFLIKYFLIKIISIIFLTKKETNEYLLNKLTFNYFITLIIFPGAFIVFYVPSQIKIFTIFSIAVIFSIIIIYRLIRSFFIGISLNKFSHFYLILYLCTVEIIPVLLMLRFLYNYLS